MELSDIAEEQPSWKEMVVDAVEATNAEPYFAVDLPHFEVEAVVDDDADNDAVVQIDDEKVVVVVTLFQKDEDVRIHRQIVVAVAVVVDGKNWIELGLAMDDRQLETLIC